MRFCFAFETGSRSVGQAGVPQQDHGSLQHQPPGLKGSEQKFEGENDMDIRRDGILGRGNSKCKNSQANGKAGKGVSVAGVELWGSMWEDKGLGRQGLDHVGISLLFSGL